jgi:prepilin-type N-terminal cleavage/methylation domain-containing protein
MQTLKKTLTSKERGFTLIELLVVIAIIAVLAALVLAALSSAQKGSRDSRRQSDLNQYKTALAQYAGDNGGSYPVVALGTIESAAAPYTTLNTGGYMNAYITDPQDKGAASDPQYYYIGTATDFGVCANLERQSGQRFAVGPTFSGRESGNANACVVKG